MEKSHNQMWEECLRIIRDNISPEQFDAWFRPVTLKSYDNHRLTLVVPTSFFVELIEERYANLLGAVIKRVFGEGTQLFYHYNQIGGMPETPIEIKPVAKSNANRKGLPVANPLAAPDPEPFDSYLKPEYNFENYLCSDSNRIAFSIGKAIGDNPDMKTFNPLFIFGPSGVGKTHLMHAIGLRIKEQRPNLRVLYISARLFESQFTVAMRKGVINDFIRFYQSIDVLLIDDIQDLIGKEKTQNTFFHIFTHLHLNNKHIIISSDCSPVDLKGMPDRLLTRMRWGTTVELQRPDIELRRNVLIHNSQMNGLSIDPEILEYIATNVTSSIRELEGIVTSLMAHATFLHRDITIDLARIVLANAVKVNKKQINFEMVTQCVSDYYNIDADVIFTKSRKREISDARQMVMYLAKKHAKMALTAIGTRLSRTHATVLHACKSIEERLSLEKQLHDDVVAIEKNFL